VPQTVCVVHGTVWACHVEGCELHQLGGQASWRSAIWHVVQAEVLQVDQCRQLSQVLHNPSSVLVWCKLQAGKPVMISKLGPDPEDASGLGSCSLHTPPLVHEPSRRVCIPHCGPCQHSRLCGRGRIRSLDLYGPPPRKAEWLPPVLQLPL
jgi:hypothetical protein